RARRGASTRCLCMAVGTAITERFRLAAGFAERMVLRIAVLDPAMAPTPRAGFMIRPLAAFTHRNIDSEPADTAQAARQASALGTRLLGAIISRTGFAVGRAIYNQVRTWQRPFAAP